MPKKKNDINEKAAAGEVKTTKKIVRHNYIYAVGRRKSSIARVRLYKAGSGKITVNEKDYTKYFPYYEYQENVIAPLKAAGKITEFDFSIKVNGGGSHGQSGAVRHGISRALVKFDKDIKLTLKPLGYMTRDPRKKERKKPGLKRARRAPQWQKR